MRLERLRRRNHGNRCSYRECSRYSFIKIVLPYLRRRQRPAPFADPLSSPTQRDIAEPVGHGRHTLATQAINRGMSLEAIAAMLGHRSMDMTLRYAKIANRTVADEYFAVTDQVDALYTRSEPLPADAIGPKMARLRREHHRLLGNGYCTRPAELDCAYAAICENCSFFQTSIEFRPALQAQHDDANGVAEVDDRGHVCRFHGVGARLSDRTTQGDVDRDARRPGGHGDLPVHPAG